MKVRFCSIFQLLYGVLSRVLSFASPVAMAVRLYARLFRRRVSALSRKIAQAVCPTQTTIARLRPTGRHQRTLSPWCLPMHFPLFTGYVRTLRARRGRGQGEVI